MLKAAYALIDERELSDISIAEVVRVAGVTRPTFYQYFKDVRGLAQYAAMERIQLALPAQPDAVTEEILRGTAEARFDHMVARAGSTLEKIKAHRAFYLRVFDAAGDLKFFAEMAEFVGSRLFDKPVLLALPKQGGITPEDRARFMTNGLLWLVIDWLQSDFSGEDSVPSMAKRLVTLVDFDGLCAD